MEEPVENLRRGVVGRESLRTRALAHQIYSDYQDLFRWLRRCSVLVLALCEAT